MVLQIVDASTEWKQSVIEKGVAAWAAGPPPEISPPSTAGLRFLQETEALCNLDTPEAARALAAVLSRGHQEVMHCLQTNSNRDVVIAEMGRLMTDPDVAVSASFFSVLVNLQNGGTAHQPLMPWQKIVDAEREALFDALPRKSDAARIPSLVTILRNPPKNPPRPDGVDEFSYPVPFPPAVIKTVAANFDRLPEDEQASLLADAWDTIRSPLMLPVLRGEAQKGNGEALLRWQELEPAPATAFMREELIRANPRFSSHALRLPDAALPAQEDQIASNFVALSDVSELARAATLLYRYTTRKTLPTVLPFIDQHLAAWPCTLQIPVLAYLLKVSPDDAAPRLRRVVETVKPGYCPRGEFLPDLGYLESNPILEALAVKQIEDGTPLAIDAADYLRSFGSSAVKKTVWVQLSRWRMKYLASVAAKRMSQGHVNQDDWFLSQLARQLLYAYVSAQAWILSPEDSAALTQLLGRQAIAGLACRYHCGSPISIGPAAGNYAIYGIRNEPTGPIEDGIDYLMPTERLQYKVNGYGCPDMQTLKKKLLQFPADSTFEFGYPLSERDREELVEIDEFLRSHGYKVNNSRWAFLAKD